MRSALTSNTPVRTPIVNLEYNFGRQISSKLAILGKNPIKYIREACDINALKLAEEVVDGRRLKRSDRKPEEPLAADLAELCQAMDELREAYCEDKVDLYTIINDRDGRYSKDHEYCTQSTHPKIGREGYTFLPEDVTIVTCKANERKGVNCFSIVTSGHSLTGEEPGHALTAYRRMAGECKVDLCASHGSLTRE